MPHPTADGLAHVLEYDWPGNVRELKNVAERLVVRGAGPAINAAAIRAAMYPGSSAARTVVPEPVDVAHSLYKRVVADGECFWQAVYDPFMARDITRSDLRRVVSRGLEQTHGNCKLLVRLFNMQPGDYKRFLNFLHKHGCNPRFQQQTRSAGAVEDSATASARIA